jgi:hypothetical protein
MIAPAWKLVDCNLDQYLALAEDMLIEEGVPRHEVDTWKKTVGCLRWISQEALEFLGEIVGGYMCQGQVQLQLLSYCFPNLLIVLIGDVNCLESRCNAERSTLDANIGVGLPA